MLIRLVNVLNCIKLKYELNLTKWPFKGYKVYMKQEINICCYYMRLGSLRVGTGLFGMIYVKFMCFCNALGGLVSYRLF